MCFILKTRWPTETFLISKVKKKEGRQTNGIIGRVPSTFVTGQGAAVPGILESCIPSKNFSTWSWHVSALNMHSRRHLQFVFFFFLSRKLRCRWRMSMLMSVFGKFRKNWRQIACGSVGRWPSCQFIYHSMLPPPPVLPELLHCRHTCSTAISLSISNAIYEGMRNEVPGHTYSHTYMCRDNKDKKGNERVPNTLNTLSTKGYSAYCKMG